MKTFAIAYANSPADVRCWCEPLGIGMNGVRGFTVINGAWSGTIDKNGVLMIGNAEQGNETIHGCKIVWEGEVPDDFAATGRFRADYNGAIAWINAQIQEGMANDEKG